MSSEHNFGDGYPDSEKEFLVFGSCFKNLLKNCPKCGGVIIDQKRKMAGSTLSVVVICHNGHTELWESQPVIKRKPLGNLLLAAAILFTGSTLLSISKLASVFVSSC